LPPLAEQEQIVSEVEQRLSIVTQLEAIVEANLKRAERLRQSILKEAFAGRLVPQDPNDEPASVLLERIRKEREGQKKVATGNGRYIKVSNEPVQIDVEGTRQVELWEGVGGGG
jgi:type I restriction enzyme S subunit